MNEAGMPSSTRRSAPAAADLATVRRIVETAHPDVVAAWLRMGHRLVAGQPFAEAEAQMRREIRLRELVRDELDRASGDELAEDVFARAEQRVAAEMQAPTA